MMKREILRSAAIIGLAVVLALVTNAFASRTRKLVLPGFYPNALKVPKRVAETPAVSVTAPTNTGAAGEAPAATQKPATQDPATLEPTTAAPVPAATTKVRSGTGAAAAPPQNPSAKPIAKPALAEDPVTKFPPHPDKPYVEISGDDAAWLHARGALFLDARRTSVYEQGHIAGSRTFSVWESDIDDKVNKLFEERGDPSEQLEPIVIYCSGGDCEDSHMLAQKLWGLQFNSVYVYKDGFPDWQKRSGAVKTGSAQ